MEHNDKVAWMINWAHTNKVLLELEGECGIGRECVGIIADGTTYPDYVWHDEETYERIDGNGDVWTPEGAYHKHPCVAVLGRGPDAEDKLYEWLRWFDEHGFVVETGDVDPAKLQHLSPIGIMLGEHRYARMVRREQADG